MFFILRPTVNRDSHGFKLQCYLTNNGHPYLCSEKQKASLLWREHAIESNVSELFSKTLGGTRNKLSTVCNRKRRDLVHQMSHIMRKPVYAIWEQQRRRSASASAQSDQRLCCSLPR